MRGRPALALALAFAGCTEASAPDDVVALVVLVPASGLVTVEEQDTVVVPAWAQTRDGDSVMPGITWHEFSPRGVIALDSLTGEIVGLIGGDTTRVQVRFMTLRSDPIPVRVPAAADTVRPAGAESDTVAAGETMSQLLEVELLDLTTQPGTEVPLEGRLVRVAIVAPANPGVAFVNAPDSLAFTDTTATSGRAGFQLARREGATAADSVMVDVSATRAVGTPVPGSPVRFVVHFQ